jgi:hypothetical protein
MHSTGAGRESRKTSEYCDHVRTPSFRISTTTIGVIVRKNKILDSGPDTIAPIALYLIFSYLIKQFLADCIVISVCKNSFVQPIIYY